MSSTDENADVAGSRIKALDDLAASVCDRIIEEAAKNSLVIINTDDRYLSSLLMSKCAGDDTGECHWFEYPGQCPAGWMSLVLASASPEQKKLLLRRAHNNVVLAELLGEAAQSSGGQLVGRVDTQHLADLATDLRKLNMRQPHRGTGANASGETPLWRAVAFCGDVNADFPKAKLINIHQWESRFEEKLGTLLYGWIDKQDMSNKAAWAGCLSAIASGIAGLCECTFSTARHLVRETLSNFESETREGGHPSFHDDALQRFHLRTVLKLLKTATSETYLQAESAGVLPEFVYGLQRSSLLLGTLRSYDPAAILGDEMPDGYSKLVSSLAFLRWFEELTKPFGFSSPEAVAEVAKLCQNREDDVRSGHHRSKEARANGDFLDALKQAVDSDNAETGIPLGNITRADRAPSNRTISDQLTESSAARRNDSETDEGLQWKLETIFELIVQFFGGSKEYSAKILDGLKVMGDRTSMTELDRANRVIEVIKNKLDNARKVESLRDVRLAIMVRFQIKHLKTHLLPLVNARLPEEQKIGKEAPTSVQDEAVSGELPQAFWHLVFTKFGRRPAAQPSDSTRPGDTEANSDRKRADAAATTEDIVAIMERIKDAQARHRAAQTKSLKAAKASIEALTPEDSAWSDGNILSALLKLSRSTSKHLDIVIEKQRFQLYLLQDSWVEAERHLSMLRQQVNMRAEISEADLTMLETNLLEARGHFRSAYERYDELRRKVDPSVDPVLWSRATHGAVRTHLTMRSRPETAAIAGALAIVDLERQRNGISQPSAATPARLFVSFRGTVRSWARNAGSAASNAWSLFKPSPLKFEIDVDRGPTDDFDPTIQLRLLESSHIVVVLTRDYFESPWCINELHTALLMARFNNGCRLGWLFLNSDFSDANRDDVERYVRAQFSVPQTVVTQVNDQYLDERFRRLVELGTKIGKGLYSMGGEPPSNEEWSRFFDGDGVRPKSASSSAANARAKEIGASVTSGT